MSTDNPITDAPETPVAEGAQVAVVQTPDFREEFFSKAKAELGMEFKDESELFSHVKSIQGDRDKHMREYEAVSRKLPPALKEIADMLEADNFNGTDEELASRAYEYLGNNLKNYGKLADTNPEAVFKDHLMSSNSAYSEDNVNAIIARKRKTFMGEAAEEGLEGADAEAYVKTQMALEAKGFVPALEARKAQLRFKPQAIEQETPEQVAEKQRKAVEASVSGTWAAIQSFKGLDLGDAGSWEVPFLEADGKTVKADMLPMLNEIATPGAWFQKFLNPDGSENKAMMLEYEAFRRFSSQAASKRAADAHGDGAKTVLDTIQNPSFGRQPQGAAAENGQMTARDFIGRKPVVLQ